MLWPWKVPCAQHMNGENCLKPCDCCGSVALTTISRTYLKLTARVDSQPIHLSLTILTKYCGGKGSPTGTVKDRLCSSSATDLRRIQYWWYSNTCMVLAHDVAVNRHGWPRQWLAVCCTSTYKATSLSFIVQYDIYIKSNDTWRQHES